MKKIIEGSLMVLQPYTSGYWIVSSLVAIFIYLIAIFSDYMVSKSNKSDGGLWVAVSFLAYLTGLFLVSSIALQYIGYGVFAYLKGIAEGDITLSNWGEKGFVFPWNVPQIITNITGAGFIAIAVTGITAFRLGNLYHHFKEGK